jgi:hypothetical protein
MTLTEKAPSQTVSDDVEALFPEARRRRWIVCEANVCRSVGALAAGLFRQREVKRAD